MDKIYEDIAQRTDGNIYIGVVGPVRTGKSTFIKRFMETLVLPKIENTYTKDRARDELPQSGSGKTIMTAEPKFVPEDAITLPFGESVSARVRLIDCVGYMIDGALGQFEGDSPRMVSTPWFDHEIPMAEAAEIGTEKVINEHSTIGVVITTDGSITDFPREAYIPAEERVINELKSIGKPFVVVVNSVKPDSDECVNLCDDISARYGVCCRSVNCQTMTQQEISALLSEVLHEFPAQEVFLQLPGWFSRLPIEHPVKSTVIAAIRDASAQLKTVRHVSQMTNSLTDCPYIEHSMLYEANLGDGNIRCILKMPDNLFYQVVEEETGVKILDEGDFIPMMREYANLKREYSRISSALQQVKDTGYGIVMPDINELSLEEPEIMMQGNRYGVKLRASAPSIHLIRADIQTEVSPIVGSEKQSEELVHYLLKEFDGEPEKLWQSNIFGKSLHELVSEGLNTKLAKMPEDARGKLQETLQRIINEGCSGLICIIL